MKSLKVDNRKKWDLEAMITSSVVASSLNLSKDREEEHQSGDSKEKMKKHKFSIVNEIVPI